MTPAAFGRPGGTIAAPTCSTARRCGSRYRWLYLACRCGVAVAEQLADQRQAGAAADQCAGEVVSQIVKATPSMRADPQIDSSTPFSARRCALSCLDSETQTRRVPSSYRSEQREFPTKLQRRNTQRHDMISVLLGAAGRFTPDALVEINIGPSHPQRFASSAAGIEQHPDHVGGRLLRKSNPTL